MALFLNDFLSHSYIPLAEPILLIALIARIWTFDAAITGSYKWTADICPRVFQTWSLAEHMRTWGRFDERVGRLERTTRADRSGIRWLDTSRAANEASWTRTLWVASQRHQNIPILDIKRGGWRVSGWISVKEKVALKKKSTCRRCGAGGAEKEEKATNLSLFHFSPQLTDF